MMPVLAHNTCVTTQKHAHVDQRTPVTRGMPAQASDQHFRFALTRRRSGVRDAQRPPRRAHAALAVSTVSEAHDPPEGGRRLALPV